MCVCVCVRARAVCVCVRARARACVCAPPPPPLHCFSQISHRDLVTRTLPEILPITGYFRLNWSPLFSPVYTHPAEVSQNRCLALELSYAPLVPYSVRVIRRLVFADTQSLMLQSCPPFSAISVRLQNRLDSYYFFAAFYGFRMH